MDTEVTPEMVDVAFAVQGTEFPLDHGYALYAAVSGVLPALHQQPRWALHLLKGQPSGEHRLRVHHDHAAPHLSTRLQVACPWRTSPC